VELLAATNPQPGQPLPDISKDAVERFLQWTPPEMHKVALLAAIPRQFNRDVLLTLLGDGTEPKFDWLIDQSYIRSDSERGWFYHEKVRALMLRYQHNLSPKELNECHSTLADHFAKLQLQLQLPVFETYDDKTWRIYESERVYHLFSAALEKHWYKVVHAFLLAFHHRWRFAVRLADLARQVLAETHNEYLEHEVTCLEVLLSAYEKDDYAQVIQQLNRIQKLAEQNDNVLLSFLNSRGLAYFQISLYDESLKDFNQALKIDSSNPSAIAGIGGCYLHQNNIEKALDYFNRAIELDKENAWAIASRGQTYGAMGKYEEALQDFKRAIEMDEKNASMVASRGQTYRSMGKYDEALQDFNRAIGLDEKYAWAIASRGQTYQSMGEYDKALQDFDRAIELDEKNAWAIASRGQTYRSMGKYDEALQDFNRAIGLDEKYAWAIASRGETYRLMDKYDEALQDLNRAIELDEKNASMVASRGETYRLMDKYDEALQDFKRAIELDEKYARAIASRGQTYRSMGKYDEALQDFNRAIGLDEKYASMVASRGIVHRVMGKLDNALSDLDRAINFDDKMAWAIIQRGIVYRILASYEKALDDFNRALEIDAKPYYSRGETYRLMGKPFEAIDDFAKALVDEPEIAVYAKRAVVYKQLGEFDLANLDLEKALTLQVKRPDENYDRAIALIISNRIPEALAELEVAFADLYCRTESQTDDLLDPIRELPEFKALLMKYS
jgi:tetratricopeptide (TPR) repeat protein